MRIKKFHGNITLLTLFILLSCALMGVLVALYMKNFIKYSDEITSYEKTNYLAKAGTELGLAIVGSREIGLEYSIDSGNNINKNFECPYPMDEGDACPVDPKFSLSIDGLGNSYQGCSSTDLRDIKPGLSAIIPLFRDKGEISSISNALTAPDESGIEKRTLSKLSQYGNSSNQRNYGVVWMYDNENEKNILHIDKWKNTEADIDSMNHTYSTSIIGRNAYLIVANPKKPTDPNNTSEIESLTQSTCISDDYGGKIAQETVKIVSIGYYNNRQLGTETLATKALPTFLQGDNYIY